MSTEPICLTTPPAKGPAEEYILPENILDAIPLLARLAPCTDPFVRKQAEMDIREALEGRGPEALRQLEAALDYGDCSSLKEAALTAENLDSYSFVEAEAFRIETRKELLAKGLTEQVIDYCFDFQSYAEITHGGDYAFHSTRTGLYVFLPGYIPTQRNDTMSGPSM